MIEKLFKEKTLKKINYVNGCILELIGFSSLFAFDKTMNFIHSYKIMFSIILIIIGYFIAVSVRKL